MRIGYIMLNPSAEGIGEDIDRLEAAKCDQIFREQFENAEKRPQWEKMLKELQRNDEVVIIALSNAVKGLNQIATFFELCRIRKIRVISLNDRFDSEDRMFPASTSQLVYAIGSFPADIKSQINSGARISAVRKKIKTSSQIGKKEREDRCIELYNSGICIEDIKFETGFKSNSSIYRILKNNGIQVTRRVTKDFPEE